MEENKGQLTETEIRTRYITPAIVNSGWNLEDIREEYSFTDGRIIDEGKGKWHRGERLRADYLLTYNNKFIAVVEAKDNNHSISFGIQQAINYAKVLDCPFAFSSNGDGFIKNVQAFSFFVFKSCKKTFIFFIKILSLSKH